MTTGSESGVLSYEQYYPVFEAMEQCDLVLNIHGEVPPSPSNKQDTTTTIDSSTVTVLNAEQAFLPTLLDLHRQFPKLRIVLEHCTTAAAVEAVLSCGPTVAATITAHHLYLTVDSWAGCPFNYCKPVAKLPSDRETLIKAATSGNPKFFLGSDSAPHPQSSKIARTVAAGVFTQPYLMQYVTEIFDREGKLNALAGFASEFGRRFYRIPLEPWEGRIAMRRRNHAVKGMISRSAGGLEDGVVPFRAGEQLAWDLTWEATSPR